MEIAFINGEIFRALNGPSLEKTLLQYGWRKDYNFPSEHGKYTWAVVFDLFTIKIILV